MIWRCSFHVSIMLTKNFIPTISYLLESSCPHNLRSNIREKKMGKKIWCLSFLSMNTIGQTCNISWNLRHWPFDTTIRGNAGLKKGGQLFLLSLGKVGNNKVAMWTKVHHGNKKVREREKDDLTVLLPILAFLNCFFFFISMISCLVFIILWQLNL